MIVKEMCIVIKSICQIDTSRMIYKNAHNDCFYAGLAN
jgi:hypothetical protein